VQYLLAVIDATNRRSTGSIETSYKDDPLATDIAIPVQNVWDATSRLFNCKAGGYYKAGAVDPATGLGSAHCESCGAGYYCPADDNFVRSACTYGAAGCPGENHSADDIPQFTADTAIVTDGLMVHLDAINNTGAGHDANAATWADLSGNGNNFVFLDPAPTIGLDGISFFLNNSGAKSAATLNLNGLAAVTVEMHARALDTTLGVLWFEHTENWNKYDGGFGQSTNNWGNGYCANACHSNQYGAGTNNYVCNVNDFEPHTITNTFSTVSNLTGRLFYFDAALVNSGTPSCQGNHINGSSIKSATFANAHFFLGTRGDRSGVGAGSGTAYPTGLEIQSVRIYNRQLTAAEVCRNAWADYKRFGGALPGCSL
jgi:hypothetical protein